MDPAGPERRSLRERAIPLGLALLALLIAVLQRPGQQTADTKVDLHVDPMGFLSDVAAVWTNTGALGEVQGGQYAGYLFPAGPFFALGDLIGLPDWLVTRLWLAVLLAFAAWGTVRLLDALLPGPRGAAHVVAGLLVMVNPYTVVYTDRASVTLLGLAALPWLLLCVHRGLREPRGWWWPAATALVVASAGAGVNAAVTAWILAGPVALAAYELLIREIEWRAVFSFAVRAVLLGLLASAWWVAPVLIQTLHGIDFLQFTEQPGAIWSSTSLTESLRLMGYWPSYLGLGYGGFRPFYDTSPELLFSNAALVSSLVVPAVALAAFVPARRWQYGPLFLLLVLVGLLIMAAGFPPGTPLRQGLTFTYNHVAPVQFLRTSHKAGPLVALGLACLAGYGASVAWARLPRGSAVALAVGAAILLAVSVWPLTAGRAVDGQLTFDGVPSAWQRTGEDLDRGLAPNSRAVVIPGQLLAYYRWGQTVDPILPALTDRPVAVRQFVPRADLHAVDALWSVDALVQQERLLPRQLRPLLGLLSAGALVTGTDDDTRGSGAIDPADAQRVLARQGLGAPEAERGPRRRVLGADGAYERPVTLGEVRRQDLGAPRGIVRVLPESPPTLVDGSADALTDLAAFGALPARRPIRYAADSEPGSLRRMARTGADLVISDSNRRRVFVTARLRQNVGATLAAGSGVSEDAALLDPFPDRSDAARTVAVLDGARSVRAPYSPGFAQFPETRPAAAFDGSASTEWLGDSDLDESRRYLEVEFDRPRRVPYIDVLPAGGARTATVGLDIGGRGYNVKPGWNRLRLPPGRVGGLRLLLRADPARPDLRLGNGLAEVRIPGLRVRESLRPPTLIEHALRGTDLRRSRLTYLFSRTTADRPFRRDPAPPPSVSEKPLPGEDPEAARIREAEDPESELSRVFSAPADRRYVIDAWVAVAPDAPDHTIDRLEGTGGPTRFDSSGRFQGLARHRASAAFDGDPRRAWVSDRLGHETPYLAWRSSRRRTVRTLRLVPAAGLPASRPNRVGLRADSASSGAVRVGPDGRVDLPRALSGRSFRLDVLATRGRRRVAGGPGAAVAIADVQGAGIPRAAQPPRGALAGRCRDAEVSVAGRRVGLRSTGSVADVEAGRPVRADGCGRPLSMRRGRQRLTSRRATVSVHHLRLRSDAPAGLPAARGGGVVTDPGRTRRGDHRDVEVRLAGPSWLVLGESFNGAWRARCDGDDLGEPVPIDGLANGWRAPGGCRDVEFAFAPQGVANAGYVLSAIACALMLGFLVLRRRRPAVRRASPAQAVWDLADAAARPWPLRHALLAGAVAALVLGFMFALRAGPPAGLLVALVLWRGIGAATLTKIAVGLLAVAVPAVYLLFPPEDRGGYNSSYAQDLLGAHWIGVAAFVLLALALARSVAGAVSTARRRHGAPAHGPDPGA